MIGRGDNDDNRKTIFSVDTLGSAYARTHINTGADVAEYYEAEDQVRLPVSTTVVFSDNIEGDHYIRASNEYDSSKIVGVVSDTAAVMMNASHSEWHDKYIDGEINPLYNDKLIYISRSERDECIVFDNASAPEEP